MERKFRRNEKIKMGGYNIKNESYDDFWSRLAIKDLLSKLWSVKDYKRFSIDLELFKNGNHIGFVEVEERRWHSWQAAKKENKLHVPARKGDVKGVKKKKWWFKNGDCLYASLLGEQYNSLKNEKKTGKIYWWYPEIFFMTGTYILKHKTGKNKVHNNPEDLFYKVPMDVKKHCTFFWKDTEEKLVYDITGSEKAKRWIKER